MSGTSGPESDHAEKTTRSNAIATTLHKTACQGLRQAPTLPVPRKTSLPSTPSPFTKSTGRSAREEVMAVSHSGMVSEGQKSKVSYLPLRFVPS